MKLLIDIDDNLYTRLFDNGVDNYDDAADMAKAIRTGTPLQKGRWEYRDAALAKSCAASCSNCGYVNLSYRTPYCPNCLAIMEVEK